MINHIVLFKLKSDIRPDDIKKLAEELESLKRKIPGITEYSWGSNVSPEHKSKGYTHGFIMTFENEDYRNRYLSHPAHTECVTKYLYPIYEDVLVFDIKK